MRKGIMKHYNNKKQPSNVIEMKRRKYGDSKDLFDTFMCRNKIKYGCCILFVSMGLVLQMGRSVPVYAFSEIVDEELELIIPDENHQTEDHREKEQYKYETNQQVGDSSSSNSKPETGQTTNQAGKPSSNNQSSKPSNNGSEGTNQPGNQSTVPQNNGSLGTNQSGNQLKPPSSDGSLNKASSGMGQFTNPSNNVQLEDIQLHDNNRSFRIDISTNKDRKAENRNAASAASDQSIVQVDQEQPYDEIRKKQLLQKELAAIDDTLNGIMTKKDVLSVAENAGSELYGKYNYDIMAWSREFFSIAAIMFFVLMFFIAVLVWLIRRSRERMKI